MKQVDLVGLAVEATSGTPIVVLREQDLPHRLLPIFVGSVEAAADDRGRTLPPAGGIDLEPLTLDAVPAVTDDVEIDEQAHLDSVEPDDRAS